MFIRSKRFLAIITLAICFLSFPISGRSAALSPSLENIIGNPAASDSLVSIIIFANDDSGSNQARKAAALSNLPRESRHRLAIEALQSGNSGTIEALKNKIHNICGDVKMREFWIVPALALETPISKLSILAVIPEVKAIIENASVELIEPIDVPARAAKASAVYSHLTTLNIPALWKRGLTGKGRLVCNFDTGVEGTHPALDDKWRGRHASCSASWFAPASTDSLPLDRTGHGTHTMGLMVGSTATDSFGVAPDAEWIGAAVIDQGQTLNKTIADILAAFQWAADPDGNPATVNDVPDVILNSWGIPTTILEPCDQTFYQVIDNVEAAGIVTVFAAGNEGPGPKTLRIPANRASSPLNSFAVGAIDGATNIIATFSSRGPSSCDTTQKKPEVVAPGIAIYSCTKGGTYVLKSGTSMAAPLIAGLAALLRQYNPEATVEEIKNAIIRSARDLGPVGEDNDYGYGLPDAEAALSYMPVPPLPEIYLADQLIGGDGIADPGETFDLFVKLGVPAGGPDSVSVYLRSSASGVSIKNDRAIFIFEQKSFYSINIVPYVITFDDSLPNGREVSFQLHVSKPNVAEVDTIDFEITVGHAPNGNMLTQATSSLQLTVTDFGQFGLGANSIYPAGGAGFRFQDSENLLYEAGIIVGRNAFQLSSSVRDSVGHAYLSDFRPIMPLSSGPGEGDGGFESKSSFSDHGSEIPIPITISQAVYSYDQSGDDSYLIIKYQISNKSNENMNGLYFGFMADFDLNNVGDRIGVMTDKELLYQTGGDKVIGLLPLTQLSGMTTLKNGPAKIPLTDSQKFGYISRKGIDIDTTLPADFMTLLSFGPFNLSPLDSAEVSLAIIAGEDLNSLRLSADRAAQRYLGSTNVDDDQSLLPGSFKLHQNYPNPFNPATVISFENERTTAVELVVYNTLGQKVTTLFDGMASPGTHQLIWKGCDDGGNMVASGIYYYRLKSDSTILTKKMLLIK